MAGDLDDTLPETTGMFAIRPREVADPAQRVIVRVVAGADMVRFAQVPNDRPLTIGRDATNDIALDHPSVSRRHVEISLLPWGAVEVTDLGSTNGTWRNGTQITAPTTVDDGDRVEVGKVAIRIERMGSEEIAHLERVAKKVRTASHDPLTGLATRAWFDEELEPCLRQHQLACLPLSCVFIDIDHFKSVNDTFGHAGGDEVLRATARLVVYAIRSADVAIRYGGEEIVTVLRGCDIASAHAVAERIRVTVAAHPWSSYGLGDRRITVSCGIAEAGRSETAAAWFKRADDALYRAKREGRNRTVIAA